MNKLGWDVKIVYPRSKYYGKIGVTIYYNMAADDYSVSFNNGEAIELFRSNNLEFLRPHREEDFLLHTILNIFKEQFPKKNGITKDTSFSDLDFGELDRIEISMQMEDEFEVPRVGEEHTKNWETVGDVFETMKALLKIEED